MGKEDSAGVSAPGKVGSMEAAAPGMAKEKARAVMLEGLAGWPGGWRDRSPGQNTE